MLIKFLGPISKDDLEVEVANVDELKKIIKQNVDKEWLDSLAVGINGKIVDKLEIKDGDEISLLPPVCGG